MSGCGWLIKDKPLPQPTSYVSGQEGLERLLQRLKQKGASLKSLSMEGYVQVTFQGKTQPKIRFQLYWMENGGSDLLRVKGLGLFGTTVFDLLINENALWLYISKFHRVFWQPFSCKDPDLAFLPQKLGLVLNPWSILSRHQDNQCTAHLMPQEDKFEVKCQGNGYSTSEIFIGNASISPHSTQTPEFRIAYKDTRVPAAPEALIYPAEMEVELKKIPLHLTIHIKEVSDQATSKQGQIFNERPFYELPLSSLQKVFQFPISH